MPIQCGVGCSCSVNRQQPVEIGQRTCYREAIARASYTQTQWNLVQAELLALVETYRAHQTATYRREKWLSSQRLSRFHAELVETLRRQREANQVGPADVIFAEVESHAIEQEVEAARQEYETALGELRRRIGIAEFASSIEPAGDLQAPEPPPAESEESLISTALASRPEIQAAKAQLASSRAAPSLARADRIPVPSVGPAYEKNETGASFYGIALTSPVPLLNTGKTLVLQREAEYHRDAVVLDQWCQRVRTEVRASLARWEQARQSLVRSRDFASCRDGTLAVARETSPGKFAIVETAATKQGAKTMGLDPTTHMFTAHARGTIRSRRALPTTDRELTLIAAAAIMGLSKTPKKGNRMPAAIGTPKDVVHEGEEEVLPDVSHHAATELNRLDDAPQVALHESDAGRFHRYIRSCAHRNPYVGRRQGRGVIDAVSRHSYHAPLGMQ